MSGGLTVIPQFHSVCSPPRTSSGIHQRPSSLILPRASRDNSFKLFSSGVSHKFPRTNLSCKSTSGDSGDNESRAILDAFFFGKAVAEAVNERVESAVGEFLSTVGRLQAEQQKQVQEFQEEVLEKARRAKEQAAREAREAQGQVSKSTAVNISTVNGFSATTSSSVSKTNNEDPFFRMLNQD